MQQIDQLVKAYADLHRFDGSVLVARKGKVILKKGYGLANREWSKPNTPETRFRIASLTKQFTAMLVMQLKQAGKLNVQAPVGKYLPWYNQGIGGRVTIHQLLTHTSGIPDYTHRSDFFKLISRQQFTPKDFVERFCSEAPTFEPGTQYSYSNSGYYMLGVVIETLTGKPLAEVLNEQILIPLGMTNSGLDVPERLVKSRASGYTYSFGDYTNADFIDMGSTIYAAGGMYSTVEDLLRWDRALYTDTLLAAENRAVMFTPYLDKYAYGMVVNKTAIPGIKGEMTLMVHTGGINGFRAILLREIVTNDVIILLSSMVVNDNFELDLNPISNRIFSILNGLPYELPKPSLVSELGERISKGSMEAGLAYFRLKKTQAKARYDLTTEESELNMLGYFLLGKKKTREATAVFELNITEFPASWNAFDSYAEALAVGGQTAASIENYRRSLALNPQNTHAADQIKVLEKNR